VVEVEARGFKKGREKEEEEESIQSKGIYFLTF